MFECSKSIPRRLSCPNFSRRYFVGEGIDIGGKPDPLSNYVGIFPLLRRVRVWDMEDGDAQDLKGVADESLDFVHSSHCLEHVRDPRLALLNWFRVIKHGGYLVIIVPDEDLYEQGVFPSTFNGDHKWTFTTFKFQSWSAKSVNIVNLVQALGDSAMLEKIELLDATYRDNLKRIDQTHNPVTESAIEFIVRKRPPDELVRKGRLPKN